MKTIVVFCLVLIFSFSYAQRTPDGPGGIPPSDNLNGLSNADMANLTGNPAEWSKIVGVGYDFDDIKLGKTELSGSAYLFDTWTNSASVLVENKRYIFPQINYHIFRDEFMSKMENDSIFVLNFSAIDRILINNRAFRNIFNAAEGSSKVYEVIVENKEFSILKSYTIDVVKSSPNPMVNRPKPKIKRTSNYHLYKNETLSPLRLKKSSVLKLLGPYADKAEQYADKQRLSFKKDEDLKKIVQHVTLNN